MSEPARDIVIAHTSDVHVDHEYTARANGGDGARPLAAVLTAAKCAKADVVLLCGDTFDCHRIPLTLARRAAGLIRAAGLPVVLLPGNHDPAIEEAVWSVGGFSEAANLRILGVTCGESVVFESLGLEVWGRPHRGYGDMEPLENPPARRTRWRAAMAHGHYEPAPDRGSRPRACWLIGDEDIAAARADYLALGHWNRAVKVGPDDAAAYYSGSPDYAKTINVARLCVDGAVVVERLSVDLS